MTGQTPRPAPGPVQPVGEPAQPADGRGAQPGSGPVLEVVRGQPSAEELAALTVVLAAALAQQDRTAGPGGPGRAAAGWASRSRGLRAPLRSGPDAWRRSARPG